MKFKFEKWKINGEEDTLHFTGIEGETPLANLPTLVVGCVDDSYVKNINNTKLKKVGDYKVAGAFMKEFHSDPVPWEDFTDDYYLYYPIERCPYTGEPIEIEIIKVIDKSKELRRLEEELEWMRDIYKNSDSVKQRADLEIKIRSLDNKINELLDDSLFVVDFDEDEEDY